MPDDVEHLTLSESAARQLANATKTRAQWRGITPRWLINFLSWTPVEAGIFRLNRVREEGEPTDVGSPPRDANPDLPETYVDYVHDPREHFLHAVTTVLGVQTRVSDLYSQPFDQVQEQLRLLIEGVKEKQESELINNSEYGLLSNVAPTHRIRPRKGPPTPDDIDELLTKVWKEPSFFLAHPRAIAAFGRECTRRGVPPPTITLFGTPFVTWRGVPFVPSDKIKVEGANGAETSKILLIRTGEKKQGVVGLFQPGVPGEVAPSLSIRFMGINRKAIASYLISLYSSLAVLTDDALAALDDVQVGRYPEYTHAYG
jgi:Phage capsid-like protein